MPIGITDTTLRDAHQSLWATRMSIEDMLPIAKKMDSIGFHSVEVWGGATFDVCLRYLQEDPWERLRKLKGIFRNTPLQMLLRGQSLLGYQHYPDDVVEDFVAKSAENGIDIIRTFDALNDIRNLKASIKAGKKAGVHVQATVVYTISPVHTTEHYLKTALDLADLGADSICIKDMAGLLTPYVAYELVKGIKRETKLPVQLHSHYIGGLALATYIKAVEAGVDVVDTASVPLAFGASQPPTETMVRALQGTEYDTNISLRDLFSVAEYFETIRKEHGYERGFTRINDMKVFEHQVPGGMISNLVSQLEEQKAVHRLPEVLEEIPKVREDLGYPPLVTPTSQIVGTQSVLNVLTGQRYKLIPGEVKAYVEGFYGEPPAKINPEILKKVLGDKEPHTCRPADLLEPKLNKIRKEVEGLGYSEEDMLSYALFPQVAKKFFENRNISEVTLTPIKKENNKVVSTKNMEYSNLGHSNLARDEENGGLEMNLNLNEVKELLKLVNQTDIAEVALENQGMKIAIRKNVSYSNDANSCKNIASPVIPIKKEVEELAYKEFEEPIVAENKADDFEGMHLLKSPMVGTFYSAPDPEAPPFVEIGQKVEVGQTLAIIEAMKLMNELESEVEGEVVSILVKNGEMVEYGQPIMAIK